LTDRIPSKECIERDGTTVTTIRIRLPQARGEPRAIGQDPILERGFIDRDHRHDRPAAASDERGFPRAMHRVDDATRTARQLPHVHDSHPTLRLYIRLSDIVPPCGDLTSDAGALRRGEELRRRGELRAPGHKVVITGARDGA